MMGRDCIEAFRGNVYMTILFQYGALPSFLAFSADDMGLGKSLVVISLIASNRRGLTPPVPFIGVINGGGATASAAPATGAASQAESASSTIENNKKGSSSGRRKNGRSSKGEQQQEGDSDDEVQIIDPPPQPPKKAKVR